MTVLKKPRGILIGILCHYTIMPVLGFTLATVFSFPKEIAAGIILVGCCPSGLASNVMSFLARANLALSVSVTAVSTLLAPFLTPMLMRLLGGEFIEIQFWPMVWDIVKIVILPILAGLIFHYFVRGRFSIIDKAMPIISMAGIALIIVVITATGRESLLQVGLKLILVTFIQNVTGYTLGYWSARLFNLSEKRLPDGFPRSGNAKQWSCFRSCFNHGKAGNRRFGAGRIRTHDEYYRFGACELVAQESGAVIIEIYQAASSFRCFNISIRFDIFRLMNKKDLNLLTNRDSGNFCIKN